MYYPLDSIEQVKGVGEYLGKRLRQNNIKTVLDLLNYFPFRYEDLSKVILVKDIIEGETIVCKGSFKKITSFRTRTGKQLTKAIFYDESGEIEVLWFNSKYIESQLTEEQIYMLSAKPSKYGNKVNIVNPTIELSGKTGVKTGIIVPVYYNVNGIHMTKLKKLLLDVTENVVVKDFLDNDQLVNYIDLKQAYKNIHFPKTLKLAEQAQDRIALNEIIHVKLHSEKVKNIQSKSKARFFCKRDYSKTLIGKLPFKLTKDQKLAVEEIYSLMNSKIPMNTLVSGDVGSGKTIIAVIASFNVTKNKGKAVYLAPTVVLANQIYKEYLKYFDEKDLMLVTQKTSKKAKDLFKTNKNLPKIIIGTHAVLNIKELENYGDLVIIDEQHKFGVKQRAKLVEQTAKNLPHVITMTATPIPRSLALTYFGEMRLIQIKTKPKGRKKIKTSVLPESKRKSCYTWLKQQIKQNSCYYIVPFIDQSESEEFSKIKNITQMEIDLTKYFGKENITTLHGKFKEDEKKEILDNFKAKKGGILLSTQVVEVGVDISDATVIVIESAERFGLSSLHQLRGRVGRNDLQSYCFLFTSTKQSLNSPRLKAIEKENNGFKLAEIDLKQRGSGEVFGLRQSGEIDLKFVDFSNLQLIETAAKIAKYIYSNPLVLKEYQHNPFTKDFLDIKDN